MSTAEGEAAQVSPATDDRQAHSYVAIDLGGTQLRAALFTSSGRMITRWSVPTPSDGGSEHVMQELVRQVTAGISKADVPPRAIAVSCLGHIDQATGSVHYAPNPPGFTRLPLGALLAERFALPVSVINDANAAAVAEWRLGAGRETDNFCFVTVSTGIGCGLIVNGRVLSGRLGSGGELGRVRLHSPDGMVSARLEDVASGTAIAKTAKAAIAAGTAPELARLVGSKPATAHAVAAAANLGEPHATRIMNGAATTLGIQLANLIRLISPEVIVIGGGVSRAGAVFWTPLHKAVRASLQMDHIEPPPLVPPTLSDDAGLYGAVLNLLDDYQR